MLGDMSDRWSVFQHKHKNELAPCGTPSFPEGNVMHGGKSTGFKHWTLQKLGWHNTQDMPDLKPSMGDSTLHSVSVVAVVSERLGAQLQMHCAKECDVSTVLNSMLCHNDPV